VDSRNLLLLKGGCVMLLARFRVQPAEKRKFTVDYTNRLGAGELLTAVLSTTIDPISVTTPFVISAAVETTQDKVTMYSSGGEDGVDYKVELLVQTSDMDVQWEDEIIFIVEDI
jgi:hypothetical protein